MKTYAWRPSRRSVAVGLSQASAATTLTIATVNNGDMIRMQKLTDDFTRPRIPTSQLEWVTLEENVLRQKVTTDIATKGGQFDVLTIGTYEVPIWAKQGWLVPLDNLGADYDVDDLLPAIRAGLSADGKLYAAPFYGESSMVMYRKDLLEKAGLTMPDAPTWDFIADAARKMTDKDRRDLRHLPARQGRLGREHGLPDRHVELLRRALVRRELEAAVRPAGVEEHARLLRQPDEGRRPAGRLVERLQREPGAVQRRQVRHVDRRHGRRLLRHRSRRTHGRRQGRLRARARTTASARTATGCGPGRSRFRPARRRPTRPRSSSPGRPARTISTSSPRRKAGPTCLPARAPRSTTTRNTRRRRRSPR